MRTGYRAILALLFAFGHVAAAQAGLRAVYYDAAKSKQLTVEVADNGDARIGEADSSDYGLVIGGHFIVVGDQQGRVMAARIEDVGAAVDQVVPPIFHDLLRDPSSATSADRLTIEPAGEKDVGGKSGHVYHVRGFASGPADKAVDYVISSDPALVPVGRTLEQFMNAGLVPMAVQIGPAISTLIAETHQIFALGTPIDVGGRFQLDHVETVDIPPARFAVPAALETIPALVAAMRAGTTDDAHR